MTGQPLEQTIQGYLSGKTSELEVEHRVQHKDGSFRWMLTRGVAMRDPEGRPIRFIGSSSISPIIGRAQGRCERARGGSAAPSKTPPSASPRRTPTAAYSASTKSVRDRRLLREELLQRTSRTSPTPTIWRRNSSGTSR